MIRPPPRSTRTATPFPTRRSSDLAVTIAVLDEVADVLGRGTYTRNISRALRENETHLREMLFEKMRQDPKAGRLSRLPFYKDISEALVDRSEEHTSELQSLMRISYAVFCLKKKKQSQILNNHTVTHTT